MPQALLPEKIPRPPPLADLGQIILTRFFGVTIVPRMPVHHEQGVAMDLPYRIKKRSNPEKKKNRRAAGQTQGNSFSNRMHGIQQENSAKSKEPCPNKEDAHQHQARFGSKTHFVPRKDSEAKTKDQKIKELISLA